MCCNFVNINPVVCCDPACMEGKWSVTRPSSSEVQGNQRIIENERAEEEDGLG